MIQLQYLVLLGAIVNIFGGFHYIKDTLAGKTKPNRVTWMLWATAPIIGTFASIASGVTWAALPVFMAGFVPFLVFLSSFVNKKAYWKLGTFDYLCGFCSILALVLWGITSIPVIAIIFAILSDGFAAIPTLVKSWRYPETESGIAYTTGFFNATTSFFAIKTWTFSEYAFPTYLAVICGILTIFVYKRKIIRTLKGAYD